MPATSWRSWRISASSWATTVSIGAGASTGAGLASSLASTAAGWLAAMPGCTSATAAVGSGGGCTAGAGPS
ncbi:hypothetical protein G6F57_020080 [Rhizopus arrhizus]|nr:hypothetical protein G6F57_020080 [Rhizopus arrhizus]